MQVLHLALLSKRNFSFLTVLYVYLIRFWYSKFKLSMSPLNNIIDEWIEQSEFDSNQALNQQQYQQVLVI